MDEARTRIVLACIGIEQPVDMARRLGAALGGEAGGLVEDDGGLGLQHHHVLGQRQLFRAERAALARRTVRRLAARRHADLLPGDEPIVGLGALAVDADLPGASPFADRGEADLGQVPLEPAIEPDPVVIGYDHELAHLVRAFLALPAHAKFLMTTSPNRSALIPSAKDRIA